MVRILTLSILMAMAGRGDPVGGSANEHELRANQDKRAMAILEAIAEARSMYTCYTCEIEVKYEYETKGKTTRRFTIRQDGTRMFVLEKVFDSADNLVETARSLQLDGEFYKFYQGNYQVELHNIERAKSGNFFFSPAVLGITTSFYPSAEIRSSLALGVEGPAPVIDSGHEDESGWVRISKNTGIVEALFRIKLDDLQVVSIETKDAKGADFSCRVDSVYSAGEILPKTSTIVYKRNGKTDKFTARLLKISNECAEDDFHLKNLEIPIGTPLCDNRISRYVGYWNGEEFVDEIVPREIPYSNSTSSMLGTWITALIVAAFVAVLIYFRRLKGSSSRG